MKQLNIKCACETRPEIKVMILNGATPIAKIVCNVCEFAYISLDAEVLNA